MLDAFKAPCVMSDLCTCVCFRMRQFSLKFSLKRKKGLIKISISPYFCCHKDVKKNISVLKYLHDRHFSQLIFNSLQHIEANFVCPELDPRMLVCDFGIGFCIPPSSSKKISQLHHLILRDDQFISNISIDVYTLTVGVMSMQC